MDRQEAWHICSGRNPIRLDDTADLRDDPAAWAEIWAELKDELLPQFVNENPGRRPAAWWLFSAPEGVEIDEEDGPDEAEILDQAGLLSEEELEAIAAKARQYIATNTEDFHGYIAFAVDHDLLDAVETAAIDNESRTRRNGSANHSPLTGKGL